MKYPPLLPFSERRCPLLDSLRRHHRRAQRGRIRRGPHPGRDQLPGARRRAAHPRSAPVQAGQPFEAKKLGAALVARNIARHLETLWLDKPRDWKPLVYCWRGGNRSGSMAHILAKIGWPAIQLDGGYKAYRAHVSAALLPALRCVQGHLRHHRQRQEPPAAGAGRDRRAGARPRAAGRAPRLGAGQPAQRTAADAEDVRDR
jgi:rhodanese-related sulfurtransferase